jgi:hypothetical protein
VSTSTSLHKEQLVKVIVHIRKSVEVEVPNCLVPTRQDRYTNHAMQSFAIDSALATLHDSHWEEREGWGGRKYTQHGALGYIEYPKKDLTSGAI